MIVEQLTIIAYTVTLGYLIGLIDPRLKTMERFALSLPATAFTFGVSSLIFANTPLTSNAYLIPTILALGVAAVFHKRVEKDDINWKILAIFALALIFRLALTHHFAYPESSDSVYQLLVSQSFMTDKWTQMDAVNSYWIPYDGFPSPITYRPPLFAYLMAVPTVLLGQKYFIAQSIPLLFGSALVFPTYLLGKKIFNEKTATLACALIALNPYLIFKSLETEPRTMISYMLLMTLYYTLKGGKYLVYASVLAGMSYLTHYSAVFYLISFAIVFVVKQKKVLNLKNTLIVLVIFTATISPWLIRNYQLFENPTYTTGKYIPLLHNTEASFTLDPPTLTEYLSHLGTPPISWANAVGIRVVNVVTAYLPPPHKLVQYGFVWASQGHVPSMTNALVFLAALFSLPTNWRKAYPLLVVILVASLTAPLTLGYPASRSVSVSSLTPLTVLYTVLGSNWIMNFRRKNLVVFAICALMALQGAILFDTQRYAPDHQAIEWVKVNTSEDDIFMSADYLRITYFTGGKSMVTPYEPDNKIGEAMEKFDIDYFFASDSDLNRRNLSTQWLGERYEKILETRDYIIYRS